MIPQWIAGAAQGVQIVWVLAAFALESARHFGVNTDKAVFDWYRDLAAELRPLYVPATLLVIADDVLTGQLLGWGGVYDGLAVCAWFLFRDSGRDDRWKRRRAKLAAAVRRQGARLVVVPVGAR